MKSLFSTVSGRHSFPVTVILILILSISEASLHAQPEVKAVFCEKAPVIDGFVDDDVWRIAD